MKFVVEMLTRRVDYPRFHRVYHSEEFNRELLTAVNLKERSVREHVLLPDGTERMHTYIAPRVELPSVIAKLVEGYDIGYEERAIYDPVTRRAQISVHTAGGDKLQVAAVTQYSETPEGVHTHIELDVRVKIFGVSTLAERFMAHETRKRYEVVERALQSFIDSGREATPRTPVPALSA